MQLTNWLTIVGGFALLGGAIDFFIGKQGQTKVRDWLELRWYRAADIDWGNLGRREAESYLKVFDIVAGHSLISKKRLLLSLSIPIITQIVALVVAWRLGKPAENLSTPSYLSHFFTSFVLSSVTFAFTLSFTRLFANIARHIIRTGAIINGLLFLCVTLCYCSVSAYWDAVMSDVRIDLKIYVDALAQYVREGYLHVILREITYIPLNGLDYLKDTFYKIKYGIIAVNMLPIGFKIIPPKDSSFFFAQLYVNNALIASVGTSLRLLFLVGFVVLFLLQSFIHGPVLLVWARLVENERPVFTLFFGGTAALAKLIETVVSQVAPP
jgi:hypothetical protein